MKLTSIVTPGRNSLVALGAYYLAGWLTLLLAIAFDNVTDRITYAGSFNTIVLMPIVEHLPKAISAAVAGAVVVGLVESVRPLRWAFLPAMLYVPLGFLTYHWGRTPTFQDRVSQTIGVLFPAAACLVGAWAAERHCRVKDQS